MSAGVPRYDVFMLASVEPNIKDCWAAYSIIFKYRGEKKHFQLFVSQFFCLLDLCLKGTEKSESIFKKNNSK